LPQVPLILVSVSQKLKLRSWLNGKIGGLLALEDPPGVNALQVMGGRKARAIAEQPAGDGYASARNYGSAGPLFGRRM
jgi:hypothetical protein